MDSNTPIPGPPDRRTSIPLSVCCILILLASAASYALALLRSPSDALEGPHMDDAYMFIRYARNFLRGLGVAWNPDGTQVYGTTSLLHLGVVTFLRWCLPFDDATVLRAASALPAVSAVAVLIIACSRLTQSRHFRNNYLVWAALLVPLFFLNPQFRYHSVSGMDTALSLLCNALLILFAIRAALSGGRLSLALLLIFAYLTYLARPDNLVYAILFPALFLLLFRTSRKGKYLLVFLVCMAGILIADVLIKTLVFGDPLPLSFYVKRSGFYEGYLGGHQWNPANYLLQFAIAALPCIAVLILFLSRKSIRLLIAFAVPVAVTFSYYFSVVQIMGFRARFYFPALPFVVVCSALVMDRFLSATAAGAASGRRGFLVRLVCAAFLLCAAAEAKEAVPYWYAKYAMPSPRAYRSRTMFEVPSAAPLPQLGWWRSISEFAAIAARAPAGTKIALSEYGLVGASAPQVEIIDPLGLQDRDFAHHGFSADAFFRRAPDLIWLPHPDYSRIVAEILDADEFRENYDYYPGAFDYGLAVRRDSRHFRALSDRIAESWRANYRSHEMEAHLARVRRPTSSE